MRMKLKLGMVATCLLATSVAQASHRIETSVLEIDTQDRRCTLQTAGTAESRTEAAYLLTVLKKQTENLDNWQTFMKSRKWKHGIPMSEQMTPQEASTFERLRQETKVGLLAWMVEEMRSRDLRVLIAGASAAEKMDLHGQLPKDEASDEFIIAAVLDGGRDLLVLKPEGEALLLAETGKCSFERALIAEARRVKGALGSPTELAKATSRWHYYTDLLLLARLEHVSKLQRDVRRQSLLEAPGDADHFSVVWEAWRRENRISENDNRLSGVLNYIGEKIPTELGKASARRPPVANKSP